MPWQLIQMKEVKVLKLYTNINIQRSKLIKRKKAHYKKN